MSIAIKKLACASYLSLFITAGAYAQTAYVKAADAHYSKGEYYEAAQLYEKFLGTKKIDEKAAAYNPYNNQRVKAAVQPANAADAKLKLAQSYLALHQYAKAEPILKELSETGNASAGLLYAKTLKYNGKLDEAETVINTYLQTPAATASQEAKAELESIRFTKQQMARKDLNLYIVKRKEGINGVGATYAPATMGGQLVVTSTRTDNQYNSKKPNANKLYTIDANNTATLFTGLPADATYEQGIASFAPNGQQLYITKWKLENGKKVSSIYKSDKQGDTWSAPVLLTDAVNATGSNSRQPNITADGKHLLFASDRAGGKGGYDIWYVAVDQAGNATGTATNLSAVNTQGNEEAPFYHAASKTLVFASNGLVGIGGYDLYTAKGDLGGKWANPKNMGYPVNSVKDDIYYLSTDAKSVWNNAYFSSDRQSECCLEIFSFDKTKITKTITGTVVDCNNKTGLPGVAVKVADANGKQFTGVTNANGQYNITVEDYTTLYASATAKDYEAGQLTIQPNVEDEDVASYTATALCIKKVEPPVVKVPEVNKAIAISDVFYDFGKANLSKTSYGTFDTIITLMNQYPTMVVEIGAHTDSKGSDAFNQKLSDQRAASCVAYLVSKGISADRLVAKGYGEAQPIAPNEIDGKDNPEGRSKNRRTEFKVLKY